MFLYAQTIIARLQAYWADQGCIILPSYDTEVGAGTFHTGTVFRCLGDKPWNAVYVQPSRRPADGRYGIHKQRVQKHHQMQVVMKPAPKDIIRLYLDSLTSIGIDIDQNDIRFIDNDWNSPTLGAYGMGWEVWHNGLEISQFTYFQQMGGIECFPITVEITYGLERLILRQQGVNDFYKILWNGETTYAQLFRNDEYELSVFNFEKSNNDVLINLLSIYMKECQRLINEKMAISAYEFFTKVSHTFNLIDAKNSISRVERARLIVEIRELAHMCCKAYLKI